MPTPPQALVVFADASLHRSRISRRIGDAARSLPGVQVQDLYQLYPDFFIDARAERELVKAAQLLVFVFPIGWYGMPALLKEWFDTVFRPEWAVADGSGRLHGKSCWAAVACNSNPEDYQPGERHGHPMTDYLLPLEQTARACGMRWIAPHISYSADRADARAADAHALKLRDLLAGHLARLPVPGAAHGA
ncbi:NAD(P)H-dependent oxidoreductase [Massilia niastensis]|uniref:NAD(P)H-dependent oxidoreductase n=1 Tax=Massilia niastensis TaxID=544911 RepID=UPI000378CA4C|nr:NAD(P)H-dependent oxidoreductase [Massilia niastensis]